MSDDKLAIVREIDAAAPQPTKLSDGRWMVRIFDFQGDGAFIIPPEIVEALGLYEGCEMDAWVENGEAVFKKRPEAG